MVRPLSLSLQDHERLSWGGVVELTPLSSRRSYKGTSTDSSHLHLGAAETLSLRRSDPLPQKLLAHLAEGGGADLCSLSPYMLRLSGAGFAYHAPGPETSV
ncbi:phospholipid-transporting ATPase IH-like isoform X1 [Lates japonicus]|uniref:Phospholipid-transporting ATPase IH-like isoform X1 n=1 Tax=Lates japonicus TaxID=270547 RepID=A0AAD3ME82_LATJO|nr:phospholipid-transporting ATPase IH-like isoform X1 [Lates japonicus]